MASSGPIPQPLLITVTRVRATRLIIAEFLPWLPFAIVSPQRRAIDAMRRALLGAASRPGPSRAAFGSREIGIETVLPDPRDRRAAVLRGLGRVPLLHTAEIQCKARKGRTR